MKGISLLRVIISLCLLIICAAPIPAQMPEAIKFQGYGRFHPGDDPSWALPDFDDSAWLKVPLGRFPYEKWKAVAWLRYSVEVDPSILDVPLSLKMWAQGAAEFYVNGSLVHQFGAVGLSKEEEVPVFQRYPAPRFFRFQAAPASTGDRNKHVIAIRLSNFFRENRIWSGHSEISGFAIEVAEQANESYLKFIRGATIHQILISSLCLVFSILHLLLFLFYPQFRPNFYFSLHTLSAALVIFFDYQQIFSDTPRAMLLANRLNLLGIVFIALTGLLFFHSLFYRQRRKIFSVFALVGGVLCLLIWIRPFVLDGIVRIFIVVSIAEIFRVVLTSRIRKLKPLFEDTWIIALGCIPLMSMVVIEMSYKVADLPLPWGRKL